MIIIGRNPILEMEILCSLPSFPHMVLLKHIIEDFGLNDQVAARALVGLLQSKGYRLRMGRISDQGNGVGLEQFQSRLVRRDCEIYWDDRYGNRRDN